MVKLMELYNNGDDYLKYIDTDEHEARQKHLHYLEKMKLTEDEIKSVSRIKTGKKLLVFCNIKCNDCRITLALLENMMRANHHIQYRIADREGNEELMQCLSGDRRIPLIVDIQDRGSRIVFNEFPDILRDRTTGLDLENQENEKLNFRKGLYKDEMLQQILSHLAD